MVVDLGKHFRALSADLTNEALFDELAHEIGAHIELASTSSDRKQLEADFEEELHKIYEDMDFTNHILSLELFLQVLSLAQSILPVCSIISTWFDLVLRPALREPRLAPSAREHAKELVVAGLQDDAAFPEKVQGFRRRLVDLFLLDALNENYGSDILVWVELDDGQRVKNRLWSESLEDILVRFGLLIPEPFLDTLSDCFVAPTSRLQILILLDSFTIQPEFIQVSSYLFRHPLMLNILRSLEIDNSSTVAAVGMSLIVKLLPIAAINDYNALKSVRPRLFAITGRMLCWKAMRRSSHADDNAYSDLVDYHYPETSLRTNKESDPHLCVREELQWVRLERTFDATPSSSPVPRRLFVFLYYLFPCNLVKFLRNPTLYLSQKGVESPWTVGWEIVLDELLIRTAASSILRTCAMHPSVIWHDIEAELDDSQRFASYDVSRLVGECQVLDYFSATVNNSNGSSTSRDQTVPLNPTPLDNIRPASTFFLEGSSTRTPTIRTVEISSASSTGSLAPSFGVRPIHAPERRVSLQDIIDTSVALKSGSEIQLPEKNIASSAMLFGSISQDAPQHDNKEIKATTNTPSTSENREPFPLHPQLTETVYGLQREVLLLRTELNFELWLKRESMTHISRLHRDDLLSKNAELERQRLHDRLRDFRIQLSKTQEELHKHQEQTQDMKAKHVEWSTTLSSKLNGLREEKKSWMTEATTLRTAKMDLEARLAAQGSLLAEAQKTIFELETQIKTDAHKVQRLRDYEQRIEQHMAMQRMWDKDIILFNNQTKRMAEVRGEFQAMKLANEAYEKIGEKMENEARSSRLRIQSLEAKLRASRKSSDSLSSNRLNMQIIANAHDTERAVLRKAHDKLELENAELRDELEETRAMVEVLKAQVSGMKGLVNTSVPISPES